MVFLIPMRNKPPDLDAIIISLSEKVNVRRMVNNSQQLLAESQFLKEYVDRLAANANSGRRHEMFELTMSIIWGTVFCFSIFLEIKITILGREL